tara:strand:+ start:90 stop:230 length:141 start_codon:yes stop_codon:yes gene_type:complete
MLFKFENFWKSIAIVVGSWIFFGIWDFEFATITLLALIFAKQLRDS